MTTNKVYLTGLEKPKGSPSNIYWSPKSEAEEKYIIKKTVTPAANRSLNNTDYLVIDVKCDPNEMVRFKEEPFYLQYKMDMGVADPTGNGMLTPKFENGKFIEGAEGYINQFVKGSTIFSRAEVTIDDQRVEPNNFGENYFLWDLIDKILMDAPRRKAKYKYYQGRFKTTDDMDVASDLTVSDLQKKICRGITRKNREDTQRMKFGLSNIFPFGVQSNIMCALSGMIKNPIQDPFMHPGAHIQIKLFYRKPWHALFQSMYCTPRKYQKQEALVKTYPHYQKGTFEVFNLELQYESFTPPTPALREYYRNSTSYYMDLPSLQTREITASTTLATFSFDLPVNTKVAVFSFVHNDCLTYQKESRIGMVPFITFPDNLRQLRFFYNGNMLKEFGMGATGNLTTLAAYDSNIQQYFEDLKDAHCYDGEIEDMFPLDGNVSGEQMIMLDLAHKNTTGPTRKLLVSMTFDLVGDAGGAPAHWRAFVACVQQIKYTSTKLTGGAWKWGMENPDIIPIP